MSMGWVIDGALGYAIVSIPWLLLALALGLYVKRVSRDVPHIRAPVYSGGAGIAQLSPRAGGAARIAEIGDVLPEPAEGAARPAIRPDNSGDAVTSIVGLLQVAEAQGDLRGVSAHSLLLARQALVSSRASVDASSAATARREASRLLLRSVTASTEARLPDLHAEARMELAELAVHDGDMTSACEHWQMALVLFHEAGRQAEKDLAAGNMRKNRCPTDWFLTGF